MIEEQIAKITDTMLGWEDHGILTVLLSLDYGGASQGAGGYALDKPDVGGRRGTSYGMEFIARTMRACGVREWSQIKGRTILALIEDGRVVGIKPLPTEPGKEFYFRELADELVSSERG